jgi:hypothetical protein
MLLISAGFITTAVNAVANDYKSVSDYQKQRGSLLNDDHIDLRSQDAR